jgi:predicted unusual protein kinase regulating ubiquinone biosynthesis (AarF/ABC1/UbiB family)/cytochrome P450
MNKRDQATSILAEMVATAGLADPASRYDRLHQLGPVVDSEFGLLVSGFDEAQSVLRNPRLNGDPTAAFANIGVADWQSHPLLRLIGNSLIFDRGEPHSTVRRVVAQHFTPAAIGRLQQFIADSVTRHGSNVREALATTGQADIVSLFARPIPIEVACFMLGLPTTDAPRLADLLQQAQIAGAALEINAEEFANLADVGIELSEYLDSQLKLAANNSDTEEGSVISTIAQATSSGTINADQARSLSFLLLGAGFETTSNLIANAAHRIVAAQGADADTIAATTDAAALVDAALVDATIDESLRIDAPVQVTARGVTGTESVDIGGFTAQPGTNVLVMLGAAGRDAQKFPLPHVFDLTRCDTATEGPLATLAFGSGIHHCIGHHLARLQARLALTELLPILAGVETVGAPDWRQQFVVRSLASLKVRPRLVSSESGVQTRDLDKTRKRRVKRLQLKRRRKFTALLAGIGISRTGHRVTRIFKRGAARPASDAAAAAKQATSAAETFGDLRGVMMKYGQLFSYAAPAMDPQARAVLASLQDSVPAMLAGVAESIIAAEFGKPVNALFASFDPVPVAAASIGQVHRAVLFDGRAVAVKVQYEAIAETVEADLAELGRTNALLSKFVFRSLDASALTKELNERISEELDYRIEASNQIQFAQRFRGHPFFRLPQVVTERSSQRVLTTEWLDGLRWNDFVQQATQAQRDAIGEMLARWVFSGVRRYTSFQADAHPGNFIVAPDGSWLGVLDFGLVKTFSASGAASSRMLADSVYGVSSRTPLEAAEIVGYFPPGHTVSADRFREFMAPITDVFGHAGTVTPEKYDRAIRTPYDPRYGFTDVVRQANAPAETILLDRLAYGSLALLSQLGATADWIGIIRQYGGDGGPTTELGRIEDTWFHSRGQFGTGRR